MVHGAAWCKRSAAHCVKHSVPPSAQCTLRTKGWLASGREKPILKTAPPVAPAVPQAPRKPPGELRRDVVAHARPPLELRPHSVHNGLWITAKRMRPAAGRHRSRAGRHWAATVARVPAYTGTTGSGSSWTHTAPQCRRQQHDQSLLLLSLRCCLCQSRPSADDDAVRAVRVQHVVVVQHGK